MTTVDERSRHALYLSLESTLGAPEADTLMNLLSPVGWGDVATKADLRALEERIGLRFESIDQRFIELTSSLDQRLETFATKADLEKGLLATRADLESGLRSVTRTMVTTMVGPMISFAVLVIGALTFAAHH